MGGRLSRSFSKDSRITIMLIVMGITFICELVSYILRIILLQMPIFVLKFLEIAAIEVVFNTMIVIIIYPLLQKSGELIERIFTEKNMMTRYF
ncbi:MAG: hypothetical protein FWC53_02545 [Firmicutes bacterium]|nr:hypothetical protein [Bacillota bacterium]